MKVLGAILLVIGIILLAIGFNDAAVIRARNSQRALMGSYVRDDDSYTTTLIIFGIMLAVGGVVMLSVKQEKKVVCPFCAEKIKSTAIVCRYCGKDLPGKEKIDMTGKRSIVKVSPSGKFFHCPFCNATLDSQIVTECPKCKKSLLVSDDSGLFCINCGSKISDLETVCSNCNKGIVKDVKKSDYQCSKCKVDIPGNSKYCWSCGEKFD